MIARRSLIRILAGNLLAAPRSAHPRQPQKVPRIGYLMTGSPDLSSSG